MVLGCAADPAAPLTCASLGARGKDDGLRASLIDQAAWHLQTPDEDVLADHIPDDFHCVPQPAYVEQGDLEFSTQYCNYLSLQQPSQVSVPAGAPVEVGLFHFDLTAPEPAQAHVAVLFGDEVQWERWIDIPGKADVVEACFSATRDLDEGEPVVVHFHNHGQNTWALTHIQTASR